MLECVFIWTLVIAGYFFGTMLFGIYLIQDQLVFE